MRRICLLLVSLSLLCLTAFAESPEPETFTLSFVGTWPWALTVSWPTAPIPSPPLSERISAIP